MQKWDACLPLKESFKVAYGPLLPQTFLEILHDLIPFRSSDSRFSRMLLKQRGHSFDYCDYVDIHRDYGSVQRWLTEQTNRTEHFRGRVQFVRVRRHIEQNRT